MLCVALEMNMETVKSAVKAICVLHNEPRLAILSTKIPGTFRTGSLCFRLEEKWTEAEFLVWLSILDRSLQTF